MKQKTIKTTEKAHKLIKLVCAHTGETQYQLLERLLQAELDKVSAK